MESMKQKHNIKDPERSSGKGARSSLGGPIGLDSESGDSELARYAGNHMSVFQSACV